MLTEGWCDTSTAVPTAAACSAIAVAASCWSAVLTLTGVNGKADVVGNIILAHAYKALHNILQRSVKQGRKRPREYECLLAGDHV